MTETLPPPDLGLFPALSAAHVRIAPAGTLCGRIYAQAGAHPSLWDAMRTYGPTGTRFDHHLPPPRVQPDRGVLYAAIDTTSPPGPAEPAPRAAGPMGAHPPLLYTCVAEVFHDRGVLELSRDQPAFVLFRTVRPLRLLDLSDSDWVARAGGNAALTAGRRDTARDWARAIYDHYPELDGLLYSAATLPPGRGVALTERARTALPDRPTVNLPLTAPALRAELETYGHHLHLPLLN